MPLLDLRPAELDLKIRPGNECTIRLTWPEDLGDRAFTAELDGTPLPAVVVDGATTTIRFTADVTAPLTRVHPWTFSEGDQVLIAGTVSATFSGQTTATDTSVDLVVSEAEVEITATIIGGGGGGGLDEAEVAALVEAYDYATEVALATEAATRAAADSTLDGRLDTLEAISIATDNELANAVAAEASARGAADTALDGRLDTVEAALPAKADLVGGVVPDAQIPAGITRDSELTNAITTAIDALIDGAPSALNTLNELAAAVNDDATFAAAVTASLAAKANLDASNIVAATWRTAMGLGGAAQLNVGTTAGTVAAGNDSRLTDTRTPTDNTVSTAKLQNDAVTLAKLLNSATGMVVARNSGGTGDLELVPYATFKAALSIGIADVANLTAALAEAVRLTTDQTVAGAKTFSSAPVVPDGSFAIAKTSGLQAALDAKLPADISTLTASTTPDTDDEVIVWLDGALRRVPLSNVLALAGGSSSFVAKVKAIDKTWNADTTLANITDMAVPLGASETWSGVIFAHTTAPSTTADLQYGWTFPSGTMTYNILGPRGSDASFPFLLASYNALVGVATGAPSVMAAVQNGATGGPVLTSLITFTIYNGATPGTAQLQGAQNVSTGSDSTFKAGSSLLAWKVS